MLMLCHTQPSDLEPVWDGSMRGIFLCALRGMAFTAQEAPPEPEPEPVIPTIGKVIDILRQSSCPVQVTDIAIALNDSGGDAAEAIRELEVAGIVLRVQATLFELDPQRGELYVLVGD